MPSGANSMITGLRAVGAKPRLTLSIPASATTFNIPNGHDAFYVSGSGNTIATIIGGLRPGRVVKLIGAPNCNITITDTAVASSVYGAVHATGNITVTEATYVLLEQRENGSWIAADQQNVG